MSSILPILSKIISESLLSLYPIFVKKINLPLFDQLWVRKITYSVISFIFANKLFIFKNLLTKLGLALGFTNIAHAASSYRGFLLLESGVAYTLFYTYPIMILLMSGEKFDPMIFLALIGVFLIVYDTHIKNRMEEDVKNESFQSKQEIERDIEVEKEKKENFKYEGLLMIFIAALTEAFIYFQVRSMKTTNNWNHVFISYFLGAIIYTIIGFYKKEKYSNINILKRLSIATIINGIIGSLGYYLRFFAATRISPTIYAFLSYIGIIMSFVYGIVFNNEKITIMKSIGALLIIISNFYLIQRIKKEYKK